MFNGFYKLVTWSIFLSFVVMGGMVIADTVPGVAEYIEPRFGGLWMGTSAAIFAGSMIIYIVSIIGAKLQNEPPDYDLSPYVTRSLIIGVYFVAAIHSAAIRPISIPLDGIYAFTLGMWLGLTVGHIILIGGVMWAVNMIETIISAIVDRITSRRPKAKNSPLEWDMPQ